MEPIYCDIFGPAEPVPIYGLPINLRYIYKRVPALFSTPRPPTQALIHSPQPSTSFTPTVPVQPPRQSSRQRGPPTQLGDYYFGCEEDISHRRSRRVKAADFFSQAPDRPDSPPSALRAFQPPSPANHTDIITSSHSSPQFQPNPTPAIPHPGLVFEQSATRIRTSHS